MQADAKAEAHFKADQDGRINAQQKRRPARRQPPRAGKAEKVSPSVIGLKLNTITLPAIVAEGLTALQVKVKTEQA